MFLETRINGTDIEVRFGSDSIKFAIFVTGGVITPKRAQALAIPNTSAQGPGGLPIWPSPLIRKDFQVVKSGGAAYLRRKDMDFISHTLRRFVVIPPKLAGINEFVIGYVEKVITPAIEEAVARRLDNA